MKWFKHSCTARDDQKISRLMDELGLEGYGAYMIILEVVGHEIGPTNDCFAEFSLKKWGSFAQLSAKKFAKFAQVMSNIQLFSADIFENNCRIEIPNLLKYRDNHTKNLQAAKKKVSLDKEKEKEKESDKDIIYMPSSPTAKGPTLKKQKVDYTQDFETFWSIGKDFRRKNEKKAEVFDKYRARRNTRFSVEDLLFIAERVMLNNQQVDNIEFRSGLFGAIRTDISADQILKGERFGNDSLGFNKNFSRPNAEVTGDAAENLIQKIRGLK